MLLTIITINYNNAAGLRKTVESVLNQTSHDFEYIIVDGGAPQPSVSGLPVRPLAETNSKGVVRGDAEVFLGFVKDVYSTENGFTRCSWLSPKGGIEGGFFSEPDTGIYNAMNKGIRMAKGDYVHFLNSGDWLVDEKVVEKMLSALNPSPQEEGWGEVKTDILVGNVISVRPDGKRLFKQNAKEVSLYTFYRGTIEHTSAYIRRELFNEFGLYDESLRIVSDWKWYLQVAGLRKANVQFTDTYATCFDTTGISSTNFDLDKAERRRVLEELLPAPILADYDKYAFDIDQMERLKKHPLAHKAVWLLERLFFKFEKWGIKYGAWK